MLTINRHWIDVDIVDRYAIATYSYDFVNAEGESKELKFDVTIDVDAFVSNFFADIDGELFYGQTKEKQIANTEYNEAKEKNENAILIHRPYDNIPNVFEIKTNIDSNSKITLNITIEQYLKKKFNFNEINIQILNCFYKYNIIEKYQYISWKFYIRDKRGIYDINIPSTSNHIVIDENIMDENKKCTLIVGKIINSKQTASNINELKLKYKINGEQNESNILYDDKSNTFCHIISDIITDSMINDDEIDEGHSDEIKDNILIPRRVVFVIDKSGSMSGSKWNKTISATIMALQNLRLQYDRYCILFFNGNIEMISNEMMFANDININESISYLLNNKPGGCTNINDALLKAIDLIKTDIKLFNNDNYNFFMNQLIFITDGAPNTGEVNTMQIIENIKKENDLKDIDKYYSKISIYSFGVGKDCNDSSWINDLNHSFLKLLCLNNNGIYKRIKQINCDKELKKSFLILSKPVLTNIDIKYNNNFIKNTTKTNFDTLYHGNDIIICGKLELFDDKEKEYENITATITAITGKQIKKNNKLIIKPIHINKTINIDFHGNYCNENGLLYTNNIERIWAYLRLQQFIKDKLIKNVDEYIYDTKTKSIISPLSLALKYKFVTPWTSMIVVKHNGKTNKLKVRKTTSCYSPKKVINMKSAKTKSSDAVNRPISYSRDRKKQNKQRNEIFVDVFEKICVTFNNNGDVLSSLINGTIKIKSYLSKNQKLLLALNEDLNIDDMKFNDCVCLNKFDLLKEISFKPGDHEFDLLNYRKTHGFSTPFSISSQIKMKTEYKAELTIKINAHFPEQNYAGNVNIEMIMPKCCKLNYNAISRQTSEYDVKNNKIVWKIRKFIGNSQEILNGEILFKEKTNYNTMKKLIGPIVMSFEIPMFNVSNLQIKYIRIDGNETGYNPYRWVRYVTKSESYICRFNMN